MMLLRSIVVPSVSLLVMVGIVHGGDRDRFNYYGTNQRTSGAIDFGPEDWDQLDCLGGTNLEACLGYPDKWDTALGWKPQSNSCKSCPAGENNSYTGICYNHHQSPIDLNRNIGITNGTEETECIDLHWMKYEDSTCTWDHLVENNAITVERHALRVTQPLDGTPDKQNIRLACPSPTEPRKWGRLDYSKGFSDWWFLSHIDFHVPSEHTQDGKRYSAEAQMYHYYSEASGNEAGNENELGTVSVFMEAYEDAAPFEYLEKLICQWRRSEEYTREACGLDPILEHYPGCFPIIREASNLKQRRHAQQEEETMYYKHQPRTPFQTVQDIILHNADQRRKNESAVPILIEMDSDNWRPEDEKDWDAYIEAESARQQQRRKQHREQHPSKQDHHRELIEYDHLNWFNYFLMLGARTEYYFRYEGTQTIPPCYGPQTPGKRTNTNHWRVLKDPIQVHPRQIAEMERLLANRIAAPWEDSEFRCKADTAAKVTHPSHVNVAREIQAPSERHHRTFCECKDWRSKWPEDRAWCEIEDFTKRFFETPYNFQTDGY